MSLLHDSFALSNNIPWIALVLIVTRSLFHGMVQPARETLYTLVPRTVRYKGKNAVEVGSFWRAGDVGSMILVNGAQTFRGDCFRFWTHLGSPY